MTSILLNINKGFSWFSTETIFVKGSFFDENNNYFEKDKAISYFKKITDPSLFIEKIKTINGIFTVLIKIEDELFIASDATRIFPLFYTNFENNLFISDDIVLLKEKLNISTFDEQASNEFLTAGHTLGNKTLLKNVFQLQSSEYICFENERINIRGFFFSYATNTLNNSSYSELKKQAIQAFENSFKRLITSLNNRQVVIPLSGGYDSRLIAVMLKKFNYTNVICFTYGKKNNFEIENSKKTAENLGFKWIFIEYTDEIVDNYIDTSLFKEFAHYTGKYSSMPYLQEYFAIKYLKDNLLISDNAIFIPGHSGDLLGGSQFEKVIPNNLKFNQISKLIFNQKFHYNKIFPDTKKEILNRIGLQFLDFDTNYYTKLTYSVFEDYDIKEKIAKIIFNSSNIFTFFNYEHRFPFWDKDLLSFFKDIPRENKKMKLLYDDILKNHYFEMFNVNYKKEIQPTKLQIFSQKIKKKIKPFFPFIIKKQFLIKNDWLNSVKLTNEMEKSLMKNNLKYNSKIKMFNELNIQWYYYFSIGKIK
ncbi:MAG: 7-cyano-7-deazaguanine synthase [Lutibacter sp.]|nr:7-cyano-7-deazaguanine synthase [Lutibacter sp.]MBP9600251.1 7-cyano-7-deazaguanine synthase [Lutibacter sp.]